MPRVADFAAFGEAVGRTLQWPDGTFLTDYDDNRWESTASHLEESLVATVLLRNSHCLDGWTGTASELLALLTQGASKAVASSSRWPKSPWLRSNELRRIAPNSP